MIEKSKEMRSNAGEQSATQHSPTPGRHNPQQDASTRHGFSNNMRILVSSRDITTLLALSSLLTLTISLGSIVSTLHNQILRAVVVAAREV